MSEADDCELTSGDVSEILGCHRKTVRDYARGSFLGIVLPSTRRNGRFVFRSKDVLEFKRKLGVLKERGRPYRDSPTAYQERCQTRKELVDELFSRLGLSRD